MQTSSPGALVSSLCPFRNALPLEPVLKDQIHIEKTYIVIRFIFVYMNANVLRNILILRSLPVSRPSWCWLYGIYQLEHCGS